MEWLDAEQAYTDEVIGDSTLPRLFETAATRYQDEVAQRYKGGIYDRSLVPEPIDAAPAGEFAELTYEELQMIVRRLATGFRQFGVEPGDRVAIFATTRMEWAQADLAILAVGGVVTTIYPDSTESMVKYLLDDAGATGVVVEDQERLERVLAVTDELDLQFIVSMDTFARDAIDSNRVWSLLDVYVRGTDEYHQQTYDATIDSISAGDLASIIYTSGTTGDPKGVKLTHENIRHNLNQIRKRYGPRPDKPDSMPRIDTTTSTVSFLPLAHIFERTAGHFTMLAAGGAIAYAESPDTLADDFQAVRPTVATSVPRVYEKIFARIREQASESAAKERIFHWATDVGRAYHQSASPGLGLRLKHRVADRLVFSQVRTALGGQIEMLISGGGSLSSELCALYHGMGLRIYEGYGLTETAPVVTCNPVERPQIGTIGPPLVDLDIRIDEGAVASSELREESETIGELLVRGQNVFAGYWESPALTEAAFEDGDWFRTGDIVRQRSDGYLEFIERAKQMLVLSTGKNVAPGPIEDAFAPSTMVEQCMLLGDGEKFVSAIIVPNVDAIRAWATGEGINLPADAVELCDDERVNERIWEEVTTVNETLEPHETIKRIRLVPEEFTEANQLLTPTMKKRRSSIAERYADEIAAIYAED